MNTVATGVAKYAVSSRPAMIRMLRMGDYLSRCAGEVEGA